MISGNSSLNTFIDITDQFCSAMITVWPDCPKLKALQMKMKLGWGSLATNPEENKKDFISQFHSTMKDRYKRVDTKDHTVFEDVVSLDIDMKNKYADADEDTRDCIWEYVQSLCSYSKLYHVYNNIIPEDMAEGITTMANKLAEGLENGASLQSLNIMQMGKEIAEKVDPAQLQQLSTNLMANIGSITSMIPDTKDNPEIGGMMSSLMNMLPGKK